MKKRNHRNLISLVLTAMMMSLLLIGCVNTATPPEETAPAEAQVSVEEETETVEEPEIVEEEPVAPEKEEEPVESDAPVEVISIKEYSELTDYIATLNPDDPEILIFNGVELYMIHMKEGQHYQLKADDKVLFNVSGLPVDMACDTSLGNEFESIDNYNIFVFDYSNLKQNHEFYLKKKLANGDIVQRTCYLDPPTVN